ncbi:MAG TPA: sensor histidine kinase [Galbitalea sp.]|jgi:signal transduction histidine kinase|nr:sensor histidine kinase [Galbitalea sp.]
MAKSRWWTIAVITAGIVLSALVILERVSPVRTIGAIATTIAIVVIWLILGKRALVDGSYGIAISIAFGLLASASAGFEPSMATIQCVVYPVIWSVLVRTRGAVIATVCVAVGMGTGMFFGLGATTGALVIASTIEGLSLIFSLALGLWITSIADTSEERRTLIHQLEAAQEELAVLSRGAGVASERERLAREIHDTIAQDLTGLVLTAQRGLRELDEGNTAAARRQLDVLEENARNALTETRALVASGAAVGVDGGGLAIALRRLAERFERETGIAVSVEADDTATLDRDREVVLLRCAQEALANVRKHSSADAAALTLAVRDSEVSLSISDDGSGFDPEAPSSGFGLTGLRKRLTLARGNLDVTASPGGGTTLIATLPGVAQSGATQSSAAEPTA